MSVWVTGRASWIGEDPNPNIRDTYILNLASWLVGFQLTKVGVSHAVRNFRMFPTTPRQNRTRVDIRRAPGIPPSNQQRKSQWLDLTRVLRI